LRSALNAAVRAQRIQRNPAQFVELSEVRRPRVHPWEASELGRFLDYAATDRLGALFEVMALTGLRRGEALGLRWSDVDLAAAALLVKQQLVQVGRQREFGPPKTASGEYRTVELDDVAVGALIGLRLRQDEERLEWGDAYTDLDLVFTREDGAAILPDTASKDVSPVGDRGWAPPDPPARSPSRAGVTYVGRRRPDADCVENGWVTPRSPSRRTRTPTCSKASGETRRRGRQTSFPDSPVTPARQATSGERPETATAPGFIGAPRGTRTHNLRIKSPQL
jgi:hypothetical protein